MRYILLMSHGHLASGMKHTVEMIAGKAENLISFDAYVDGNDNVKKFFENFMADHSNDEIIVVTDVLGGSVNNEILNYNGMDQVSIISGMNVALVLNLLLIQDEEIKKVIQDSVGESRETIQYFEKIELDLEEDF